MKEPEPTIKYGVCDFEYSMDEACLDVGEGWRPLLRKLMEDLFKLGWRGRVDQIKEKFGGLRFYANLHGIPDKHDQKATDLIVQAMEDSETICEECGDPGRIRGFHGWMFCRCDEHYEELKAKLKGQAT